MSKRIDVKDLNVYYSKFLAVEDVNINIEAKSVTAFIGPSGCGKSTFLRTLNRMHEVIPGARVEGEVLLDGDNLYGPGVDPVTVRSQIGMVFQRPNPFPTMSIRDNVLAGVKLNNQKISKGEADVLVERSLQGRQPVERGQGPPGQARLRPVRRPAAAPLHCPRHCRGTPGDPHGRALLRPGPDLHAGH